MTLIVQSHVYADDYLFDATFDTIPWFEQAADEEILALAKTNFGGGPEADAVAEWFEKKLRRVEVVLEYCQHTTTGPGPIVGFTTEIDPKTAMAWIREHRPHLIDKLGNSE